MIILEDLSLDERQKYLEEKRKKEEQKKQEKHYYESVSGKYEITQESRMMVLGKAITHTKTKTIWQVTNKKKALFEAEIVVLDENEDIQSQWYELFRLMKKLTVPLQKICFELDAKGQITAISNAKEIESKWLEIRPEFAQDRNFAELVKAGDADYSGALVSIHRNILYQLFFFSAFKPFMTLNKVDVVGKNVLLPSVIFPQLTFNTNVEELAYKKDNGFVFFTMHTTINGLSNRNIKQEYKKKYKKFIDQSTGTDTDIAYRIGYQSDCKVYEDTGTLVENLTSVDEYVNDHLYYKSEIAIKLID